MFYFIVEYQPLLYLHDTAVHLVLEDVIVHHHGALVANGEGCEPNLIYPLILQIHHVVDTQGAWWNRIRQVAI